MPQATVYQFKANKDGSAYVYMRLRRVSSATAFSYLLQADLTSITRNVYQRVSGSNTLILGPTTLTISDTIYDALQYASGGPWTKDDTGFNFRDFIPYTAFTGNGLFPISYDFVYATSGQRWAVDFEATVLGV